MEEVYHIDDVQTEYNEENEITQDFLSGKLSFSEYAARMEDEDVENLDVTENKDLSQPSTSQDVSPTKETKPKVNRKRVRKPLPPTLKGLMGEANLRFARGDYKTAEKMCLEVIRQIPTVPDPFLTLAQMYENENPAKSLQFALIAAHLSPNDDGQWTRLAILSEKAGDLKQADTCYAKAIHANPTNISLHLNRIKFLEKSPDIRLLNRAKMRALSYMTSEHFDILIPMAKELTIYYHGEDEVAKAMEALDYIFRKCASHVNHEIINMMLEILLSLKNYQYCLKIFVEHCNIDLEIETDDTNEQGNILSNFNIISFQLPETILIDLHIKFIICLIHLKCFDLVEPLIQSLLCEEEGVETNGDLYLDVAEAFMIENRHQDALKLLVPLVKSKNFGMAAVWLRQAECLNACELYEQAIDSYKKVMELAPLHIDMRIPLADLLVKKDRKTEALIVLEQDENFEELDPGLLFKRCKLLRELKLYNKYWQAGLLLLSRHCYTIRNKDEVEKITVMQMPDKRGTLLRTIRATRGEELQDSSVVFEKKNEPDLQEEFALFTDLVESCMRKRRYDLMQRFTFTALTSKRFKNFKADLELMAIYACILNEDCFHGYNLVRELVQRNIENNKCWNLYNIMIQRSDDNRHNRFLMRLLTRAQVNPYINALHANNCLVAGTYKYALSEYISLYRIREEPIFAFLIGVTLFHIACQKFSVKKDYLVAQGLGFFTLYKKLRGPDGFQEAEYNIGRGYHQLGMIHLAAEQYKKVLNAKPTSLTEKYSNLFDLKREAAYNLHLIYKASGAHDLAKMYLYKYIVV